MHVTAERGVKRNREGWEVCRKTSDRQGYIQCYETLLAILFLLVTLGYIEVVLPPSFS
jgi:hypothetical protein